MSETPVVPPLTWLNKISYSLGGSATIIKQRGLATLLLIFYNQVVGMPPQMVTTIVLISTIFDAMLDPIIGQVSDNFSSRLGRRHPFMYLAIVPMAIGYCLIWTPPVGWSYPALFAYLLIVTLVVRLFDTFFELPSAALLPELTSDYNQRTNIISMRLMSGMVLGFVMTVLTFKVFLKEAHNGTGGVLARTGYLQYGIAAGLAIGITSLIATVGTHDRIRYLSMPKRRRATLRDMIREIGTTLGQRSLLILLIVTVLMAIATGLRAGLELYFNLYFWALTQTQLAVLVSATLIGTLPGVLLASWCAKRFGKRAAALMATTAGIVGNVGPVLARLAGLMPANGSKMLFGILFADILFTFCAAGMTNILLTSMTNDLVEEAEVKTGRRSEGLLLAAENLCRKLVSGVGIFMSGLVLMLIAFPRHAERGMVPMETVNKLAYAYIPITVLYIAALIGLSTYKLDRAAHERNLDILRHRREGSAEIDEGMVPDTDAKTEALAAAPIKSLSEEM